MTAPAPMNQPAPPRRFGLLARLLRRWLGIADQQHDFDALALTLSVKDETTSADGQELRRLASILQQITPQLDQAMGGLDRLTWHEQRVPLLAGSKRAYDLALKRERARREQLIEQHPEWSMEQQQYVRGTGKLPQLSVAQEEAKP